MVEWKEWLENEISRAAIDAETRVRRAAMEGMIILPLYLYYAESTATEHGGLAMLPAPQAPYINLATPEGMRRSLPYSQFRYWISERCRRLPIICPSAL